MSEQIDSLTIQFNFLVLKRLEQSSSSFDTPELTNLLEGNFELLRLPPIELDKRTALITAITDYLSGEAKALKKDESGKWTRDNADNAYNEYLADWLLRLSNNYGLDIENDDCEFADTYQKLDLAVKEKGCIFTEQDKSDFVRLFLKYTCPENTQDSKESLKRQIEYLILGVFLQHREGWKIKLEEICTALKPNAQLWLARNRGRTEADFCEEA